MSESKSAQPLTDQTLARLRQLAEGNGLKPEQIELALTEEKIYPLAGVSQLMPFCERQTAHYPGTPRGKGRQMVGNAGELATEAQNVQKKFLDGDEWLALAVDELKKAPGQGWGLEGAKIAMPEKSVVLAASVMCPTCQGQQMLTCAQCQGQGFVVCSQCQGRGQEPCPNCNGSGQNPHNPAQLCPICNGQRTAPCRFCRASGKLVCPTCQGRRGTACPACKGAGSMTEEVGLACGVTVSFRVAGEDVPAGLRRGLDRLGMANLSKGHADITLEFAPAIKAKKEGERAKPGEEEEEKTVLRYRAMVPYADARVRFGGGRPALISVFGKKALLMGVPSFLDDALEPWREHLRKAAKGEGPLDSALGARAMREALGLMLAGEGQLQNFRKFYSLGLSGGAMREILQNMDRALKRLTLRVRIGAAAACGLGGAALLAALFFTPLHGQLTGGWPAGGVLAFDIAVLSALMGLSLAGLSKAMQFALKRRFAGYPITLLQKTGRIGFGLMGGIAAAWVLALLLAPAKPLWINHLLRIFG